jgi:hypothetical protein
MNWGTTHHVILYYSLVGKHSKQRGKSMYDGPRLGMNVICLRTEGRKGRMVGEVENDRM